MPSYQEATNMRKIRSNSTYYLLGLYGLMLLCLLYSFGLIMIGVRVCVIYNGIVPAEIDMPHNGIIHYFVYVHH